MSAEEPITNTINNLGMKMRSTGNDHTKKMHNHVKKGFQESDPIYLTLYYMFIVVGVSIKWVEERGWSHEVNSG